MRFSHCTALWPISLHNQQRVTLVFLVFKRVLKAAFCIITRRTLRSSLFHKFIGRLGWSCARKFRRASPILSILTRQVHLTLLYVLVTSANFHRPHHSVPSVLKTWRRHAVPKVSLILSDTKRSTTLSCELTSLLSKLYRKRFWTQLPKTVHVCSGRL